MVKKQVNRFVVASIAAPALRVASTRVARKIKVVAADGTVKATLSSIELSKRLLERSKIAIGTEGQKHIAVCQGDGCGKPILTRLSIWHANKRKYCDRCRIKIERARDRSYYVKNREKVHAKMRACREKNREKFRAKDREWRAKNLEMLRANSRARREKNREKLRLQKQALRAKDPEKARTLARVRRAKNREKVRAQMRAWHEKNREKVRAQRRVWREKNRDKLRVKDREWRAKNRAKNAEKLKKVQG